jgi:hypothetical protein
MTTINPYPDPQVVEALRNQMQEATKREETILINFIGGTYGTFLELACNVAGGFSNLPDSNSVFMDSGNAHRIFFLEEYNKSKRFYRGHFYETRISDSYKRRKHGIEIVIHPWNRYLFDIGIAKRIHNVEFSLLEVDTHNKLKDMLLNDSISKFLPEYGVEIFDCPKMILMDFFRLRYKYPWDLLDLQEEILRDNTGFQFNFDNFTNKDKFLKGMHSLFDYAELPLTNIVELESLYDEFAKRQATTFTKSKECSEVLENTYNGIKSNLLLDCSQQGYVIASIEQKYNIEIRDITEETFFDLPGKLKEYL